jgi:hypothetical protein
MFVVIVLRLSISLTSNWFGVLK